MYLKSYKYYLKLYKDLPEFDRGLGKLFFPALLFFIASGCLLFPLILIKGSWLFGKRNTSGNKIVEFVFGSTHHKISSRLKLPGTDKLYFNIEDKNSKLSPIIDDKRMMVISAIYGLETAFLMLKSLRETRIKNNAVRLIKMVGLSKFAKYHFKGYSVYVQYNDHIPYFIMLQEIAKNIGLRTIYFQHAPVSFRFPPLFHDLNVLFSNDSLTKYQFTTGDDFDMNKCMILYDVRFPKKEELEVKPGEYVLFCFNKLDDFDEIEKVVNELVKKNIKVRIRPHPEDHRKFNFNFGANTSISKGKTIWEDLSSATATIVSESAVPLEALYCDVPVYKLATLSLTLRDNYGFLKTGLLQKEYFTIEELITDMLSNKKVWDLDKLNYFLGDINNRKNVELALHSCLDQS